MDVTESLIQKMLGFKTSNSKKNEHSIFQHI